MDSGHVDRVGSGGCDLDAYGFQAQPLSPSLGNHHHLVGDRGVTESGNGSADLSGCPASSALS
jgi:hypothetical protein